MHGALAMRRCLVFSTTVDPPLRAGGTAPKEPPAEQCFWTDGQRSLQLPGPAPRNLLPARDHLWPSRRISVLACLVRYHCFPHITCRRRVRLGAWALGL